MVYVSVHAHAKLEYCDTFAHFRINRSGYIYAPAHTTSTDEDQGHIDDAYPQQTHLILSNCVVLQSCSLPCCCCWCEVSVKLSCMVSVEERLHSSGSGNLVRDKPVTADG